MLKFVIFLISRKCLADSSSFLAKPENAAVLVGSQAEIRCQPNSIQSSIKWSFEPFNDPSHPVPNELIENGRVANDFASDYTYINLTNTLVINSTQEKHAGRYGCRHRGEQAFMQLIVLGSEPDCSLESSAIVEGQLIEIRCCINFTGLQTPAMQWEQILTDGGSKIIHDSVTTVERNKTLTSKVHLHASSTLNKSKFRCKVCFSEQPDVELRSYEAQNVPSYNFTWTSENINVLYGPKGIVIHSESNVMYPLEELTCMADANPEPNYSWTDLVTGNTINSSTMVINESMISENEYHFQCTADNILFPPATRNVSFMVSKRREESSQAIHVVIWLTAFAVCLIIVAAVCFVKNCNQGTSRTAEASDNPVYFEASAQGQIQLEGSAVQVIGEMPMEVNACATCDTIDVDACTSLTQVKEKTSGMNIYLMATDNRSVSTGSVEDERGLSSKSSSAPNTNFYEEFIDRSPVISDVYTCLKSATEDQGMQSSSSSLTDGKISRRPIQDQVNTGNNA